MGCAEEKSRGWAQFRVSKFLWEADEHASNVVMSSGFSCRINEALTSEFARGGILNDGQDRLVRKITSEAVTGQQQHVTGLCGHVAQIGFHVVRGTEGAGDDVLYL